MKYLSNLSLIVVLFTAAVFANLDSAMAGGGNLPALTVAKGCNTPAKPGDIITCDISIQNTTDKDYWEVSIFDPAPAQLRTISVSPECTIKNGKPSCNLKSLNKWTTKNLWFKFQVDPNTPCNTTITNQIDVSAKQAPTNWAKAQIQILCQPKTQCSDGIDNDGDGWVDLDDSGCTSPEDNDENNPKPQDPKPQCSDGIDNDGDGWVDTDDCGCAAPNGNSEANTNSPKCHVPQCRDGIDNDGDGWIDLDDSGCTSPEDDDEGNPKPDPKPQCSDGKDNDGDGWIDLDDSGCSSPQDNDESNAILKKAGILSTGPATARPGDTLIYTVTITNPTGQILNGIALGDQTPPGLTFLPEQSSPECRFNGSANSCTPFKLNPGESRVFTFAFLLPDTAASLKLCGKQILHQADVTVLKGETDWSKVMTTVVCDKKQCSDGKDNDSDGKIDFPADPGCDSKDDDDEKDKASPVLPYLECVYDLGGGKYRAYFGYDNSGASSVTIPVNSSGSDQVNVFEPAPLDRSQISTFNPGRKVAAFHVDFDGTPITWKVKPAGGVLNSITASTSSKACRPVTPIAECADKKPGGLKQALFGYQNDNGFEIALEIGEYNKFSPSPEDRGQPNKFFTGRIKNGFSVTGSGQFAWHLGTKEAWVNDSTPQCTSNTSPLCNAGSSYESKCQGDSAKIFLDGAASRDPEGTGITYKWSTDCSGGVISDSTTIKPILTVNTSSGNPVSCSVTLKISDGVNESTCSQPVSIASCTKDCAGVANGNGKYDLCGVCNGTNACLDCAQVPNGSSRVDSCGVCGGNDACADCNGTPNGTAVLDDCGVCGGDGSSCRKCSSSDITHLLLALDIAANKLKNLCNKTGKRLANLNNASAKIKSAATEARKQCEFFYQESWNTIWTQIPARIVNCANATACIEVDISARSSSVTNLSSGIRDIVLELARQAQSLNKKAKKSINPDKKAIQDANALHETTLAAIAQVPRFTSACD